MRDHQDYPCVSGTPSCRTLATSGLPSAIELSKLSWETIFKETSEPVSHTTSTTASYIASTMGLVRSTQHDEHVVVRIRAVIAARPRPEQVQIDYVAADRGDPSKKRIQHGIDPVHRPYLTYHNKGTTAADNAVRPVPSYLN